MLLTFGIIKGEKALYEYCEKRWHERPRWCETIAHIANATIELHYWRGPQDDGHRAYYLLYMPHENGTFSSTTQLTDHARELVETGKYIDLAQRGAGPRR